MPRSNYLFLQTEALRKEVESRMKASVSAGQTVSSEVGVLNRGSYINANECIIEFIKLCVVGERNQM